jgi:hypothetical protein
VGRPTAFLLLPLMVDVAPVSAAGRMGGDSRSRTAVGGSWASTRLAAAVDRRVAGPESPFGAIGTFPGPFGVRIVPNED